MENGLKLAGELQPSVILMDLMMPVLDGSRPLQRLKSDERTAAIPVIAITALAEQPTATRPRYRRGGLREQNPSTSTNSHDAEALYEWQ